MKYVCLQGYNPFLAFHPYHYVYAYRHKKWKILKSKFEKIVGCFSVARVQLNQIYKFFGAPALNKGPKGHFQPENVHILRVAKQLFSTVKREGHNQGT